MSKYFILFTLLIVLCSYSSSQNDTRIINEAYLTVKDTTDNVDCPAIWHGKEGQNWLLATAKSTDKILVYDAANGSYIKSIGSSGKEAGQLNYPNGIFIIENLMFIIETNNRRLQLFSLPDGHSLGIMADHLVNPYGVFVYKMPDMVFRIYVTDNYETGDKNFLPLSKLSKRVKIFECSVRADSVSFSFISQFGDTTTRGALQVVESIYGDVKNNVLLIADEDENQKNIKIYDLDGNFSGKIIDSGFFKSDPEGIVLVPCDETQGYWIATDQSNTENIFYIFDRKNFSLIDRVSGRITRNTDGITITQQSFGKFKNGAFYAVHDDGGVAAFYLDDIVSCR